MEDELPPELRSRRHAIYTQVKRRGRARRYRRLGTVSFAIALVLSVPIVAVALTKTGGDHSQRISTVGPSSTEAEGTTAETPTTPSSSVAPTTAPTTSAPTSTSTQAVETTTTTLVCRNSSNPACGPLSYDPPITNMAASLVVTTEPATPAAGHSVTFTLHVTDPDSLITSGMFCGQASFGEGGASGCEVACAPQATGQFGKWDPPAPTPGDATFTLAHTYPSAGTFTARFSLTVGECGPRPSPASTSITVHVGP